MTVLDGFYGENSLVRFFAPFMHGMVVFGRLDITSGKIPNFEDEFTSALLSERHLQYAPENFSSMIRSCSFFRYFACSPLWLLLSTLACQNRAAALSVIM